MNKPIRFEQNEKKIDVRVKDRGDSKAFAPKCNTRLKKDNNNEEIAYPDGDSRKVTINQRHEKNKMNPTLKLPLLKEEQKSVDIENVKPPKLNLIVKIVPRYNNKPADSGDGKQATGKKTVIKEAEKKAIMELRRIREKYALKTKNSSIPTSQNKKEDEKVTSTKSDVKNSSVEKITKSQEVSQTKESNVHADTDSKHDPEDGKEQKKKLSNWGKKPLIRTVGVRNGYVPMYKAVTFVEQKHKSTKLDIKIPNPTACNNKTNPSKFTDTNSLGPPSVTSTREKNTYLRKKSPRKRESKKSKRNDSPIHDIRDNRSPSTEVAKWAPSSVNQQTQPYYEAWVNTRLAAVPKHNSSFENDISFFNDAAFFEAYRKALERPVTPDLIYSNFSDERYTASIAPLYHKEIHKQEYTMPWFKQFQKEYRRWKTIISSNRRRKQRQCM